MIIQRIRCLSLLEGELSCRRMNWNWEWDRLTVSSWLKMRVKRSGPSNKILIFVQYRCPSSDIRLPAIYWSLKARKDERPTWIPWSNIRSKRYIYARNEARCWSSSSNCTSSHASALQTFLTADIISKGSQYALQNDMMPCCFPSLNFFLNFTRMLHVSLFRQRCVTMSSASLLYNFSVHVLDISQTGKCVENSYSAQTLSSIFHKAKL